MQQYKDLHLARNLEDLNHIAHQNSKKTSNLLNKPTMLLNAAKKLYAESQSNPTDEELSYVFSYRFLQLYDQLNKCHDKTFVCCMLGTEATKAKTQLLDLKNSLISRYEKIVTKPKSTAEPTPESTTEEKRLVLKDENFIKCSELFNIHSQKNITFLVMDARESDDYKQSRIKDMQCINIPEPSIQSGLSAHKLGLTLPAESKELWEKRDTFDIVILMDWNTNKKTYQASKLDKLRTILGFDIDHIYNHKPVVLDSGYMEWLEMYPMLCIGSHVQYSKSNKKLDELLELDIIEYPIESDSKSHEALDENLLNEDEEAIDQVNFEQTVDKDVVEKTKQITNEVLKQEEKLKSINKKINNENDNTILINLKEEKRLIEDTISKLIQEVDILNEIPHLHIDFNSDIDKRDVLANKTYYINKKSTDEYLDSLNKQTTTQNRERLLAEARRNKKPNGTPASLERPFEKPAFDRSTKPNRNVMPRTYISPEAENQAIKFTCTGLYNIKNTCYMNATIQCLRHLPDIMNFYCEGKYSEHIHKVPPRIMYEMANLVRTLWLNTSTVVTPNEFYTKFCTLAPTYGLGSHEDCMEFFLQLFNYLSEDSALDSSSENFWSESQMAWHKQHEGKVSFFIDSFYHQIKIQQSCTFCNTTSLKFDIENVFYLTIPERSCRLQDCMSSYLRSVETFTCKKCKKPKQVKKSISRYPRNLVIALKRYSQCRDNNTRFVKNEHLCMFPVDNFVIETCSYQLCAIALHSGTVQAGHYTAACLNPLNNRWYLYNDTQVIPMDIYDSKLFTAAYAFFYTQKHFDEKGNSMEKSNIA